jgi:hypothetical protein
MMTDQLFGYGWKSWIDEARQQVASLLRVKPRDGVKPVVPQILNAHVILREFSQ